MRPLCLAIFLAYVAVAGCTSQSDPTGTTTDDITRSEAGSCELPSGEVMCNIAGPRCPLGSKPGLSDGCFTWFCIPDGACDTNAQPGTCGGPVECNIAAPECPAGTEPGASDGCWSGFCIPSFVCHGGSGSGSGSA